MFEYGNVGMLESQMWKCGNVDIWECGNVGMVETKMWECGKMGMLESQM
jgi:hypothetical protein